MTQIRPVRRDDIEALYAISLATGSKGQDASALHDDPKLIGHIYSAPYAVLNPQFCLVAESEFGVAGYVVGTLDTRDWEARLETHWWPKLRRHYADPSPALRDLWTPDERLISAIHHPMPTPTSVVSTYPSHIHMNLLPRAQGRGLGTRLFTKWCEIVVEQGARGLHVGANPKNSGAIKFWTKLGFKSLNGEDSAVDLAGWMGMCLRAVP